MASTLRTAPNKSDQVYELLRGRILDGTHRPGDRLSMDALARELGISKVPIREAVSRLEVIGFVTTRQNVGPTVAGVDSAQLQGAYLARAELEPLIAALAAERGDDEQVAALHEVQNEMRLALDEQDIDRMGHLNFRFHLMLAKMSGYRLMEEITETLLLAVRRYRVIDPLDAASWSDVIVEHDLLCAAVAAHDKDAARAAAVVHAASQAGHDGADLPD